LLTISFAQLFAYSASTTSNFGQAFGFIVFVAP